MSNLETADEDQLDEEIHTLVEKENAIKDLEAKNKALEERNSQLINKNTELEEALKQISFKPGSASTAAAVIETKWDYQFEDITLIHLRPQLMNIYAEIGDERFDIFLKKK